MRSALPLAEFQRDGADRAIAIMERRGGVLLCDSVGLGKTFTALAVVEDFLGRDQEVAICVPAALRRMWRRELRRLTLGRRVALFSHTAVALGRIPISNFSLLVIDEAHAFRNPSTLRYRRLRMTCGSAHVMLVTATPVNNSLRDLYCLLRLFCADGAFRDIGIASLRTSLLSQTVDSAHLARLRSAIIIRRTRKEIRQHSSTFQFPDRVEVHSVRFEPPIPISQLGDLLTGLAFPGHRASGSHGTADLLRYGLLKRFESSQYALRTSLRRHLRFCEQLLAALHDNRVLRPAEFRSLYREAEDTLQLVLTGVALEPAAGNRALTEVAVRQEIAALQSWMTLIQPGDDKLTKLVELLRGRAGRRTVVFTEYRDTARYLWQALRRRFPTGFVDGQASRLGESVASRMEVIAHFAPRANSARIHERELLSVLVATDVMAEGMNLQDADAVVSYDLPWNPVRLIQRAGRVDRIGSDFDTVHIYNFMPDRDFDAFLGLVRTLRNKLEGVRQTVGLERPVLDPDDAFCAMPLPGSQPSDRFRRQARGVDRRSTVARVARLIRNRLSGIEPGLYERAELLLTALANVTAAADEVALEPILRGDFQTFAALLDAAESALAERKSRIDRVSRFG